MLYLYDITTGGATVHVLIILWDLYTVDDTLELTKVAICWHDFSSLNIQFPHSQRQAKVVDKLLSVKITRVYLWDLLSSSY